MTAEIVEKNDNLCVISWSDETGFGELKIKYTNDGNYILDAELISIDKVIQIIQTLKLQ